MPHISPEQSKCIYQAVEQRNAPFEFEFQINVQTRVNLFLHTLCSRSDGGEVCAHYI